MTSTKSVAVIGSGPAGLMVASVLSEAGVSVTVIERRPGLGRKLLVAGSSGLNVSSELPLGEFKKNYSGPSSAWNEILSEFTPPDWLDFIHKLGLETFLGTSGRYFVRGMKGSSLLRNWVDNLKRKKVQFILRTEVLDFSLENTEDTEVTLKLKTEEKIESKTFSAVCFCLGGGSWETPPPHWPNIFINKGLKFTPFESANCGFKVAWSEAFLKEAEGLPLKGIVLSSPLGSRAGELVITSYGIEGTPVYSLGKKGKITLDLKPTLSTAEILKKLQGSKEKLNPIRRVKKFLNLSPAALALVFHYSSEQERSDLKLLVERLKNFPIELLGPQPLEEAISSSGGLSWTELETPSNRTQNSNQTSLMLKRFPGVFIAGEMIDWSAPTGGFLIQGCVSMGVFAGREIAAYLNN